MEKPVTLSNFVINQNDLGDFTLIATRFIGLDGKEIYLSYENGWYTDGAVCCSDLFDRGFDTKVLKNFAKRYNIFLMDTDGDIELKSPDPVRLLQTIIAVYFWIDEQNFPVPS